MVYSPENIYHDFSNNNISPAYAARLLVSLVEQGENETIRLVSLKFLKKMGKQAKISFKFLENLYVSESNHDIRLCALKIVRDRFSQDALSLIKWAFQHETNIPCLMILVDIVQLIGDDIAKVFLNQEIKKIRKTKLISGKNMMFRNLFKNQLKIILKSQSVKECSTEELADIYLNYRAICSLKKRFFSVHYELRNARVVELDLSDVEFEVRGWKSEFRNNIQNLSEISEMLAFQSLEYLDLSNNHISRLELINKFPVLEKINLSNNNITDSKEIDRLKSLKNLKFLDLRENQIAQHLDLDGYPFLIKTASNRDFF